MFIPYELCTVLCIIIFLLLNLVELLHCVSLVLPLLLTSHTISIVRLYVSLGTEIC